MLARQLYSEDEGLPDDKHISFVNGINTRKGGKHVETVTRAVLKDFCDLAKKKKMDLTPGQLKDSVVFFINATIVNPSFAVPLSIYQSIEGFVNSVIGQSIRWGFVADLPAAA